MEPPDYTEVRCGACLAELGRPCRHTWWSKCGTHTERKELYWRRYWVRQKHIRECGPHYHVHLG